MKNIVSICLCCLMLAACSSGGGYSAQKKIYEVLQHEFEVQKYYTSTFTLYGLLRQAKGQSKVLHVYIEGDGLAWISRTRPSKNPTPTDNVTQSLAEHDPSNAAVLYLARPCQYVTSGDMRMCSQKFWTSHRLAPEVITALDQAISKAKVETNSQSVAIVGYSGGGAAAVMVGAMRNDVVFIGSVAGLLDHVTWTHMHKISPLHGSLNPADMVYDVRHIPQRHLSGEDDKIVPPSSQERYCRELDQAGACESLNGMEHGDSWYTVWDYAAMPQ